MESGRPHLCESAPAAVTNPADRAAYTTGIYRLPFWRLEVRDQGVGRAGFFRILSPWLADGSISVRPHGAVRLCVSVS